MIIILLFVLIISMIGIKKAEKDNYLSKNQTNAIKGIMAILIFLSHFNSQITLENNTINSIYKLIFRIIDQNMVAIFLFYSGYGIYVSYINKKNYIKTFFKKRILKTLIHFDIAVLLFFLLDKIMNIKYSLKEIILAFTGWTSIGNSNWFIFVILSLYLITWIIFSVLKNKKYNIHAVSALSIILIIILYFTKEKYFYNTIMCFPLGMYWGKYKDIIDKKLDKHYWLITFCVVISFAIMTFLRKNIIAYEFHSMLFCVIILLITNKIEINNRILAFLGKYSFEIYILQRLSFIVFKGYINNTYLLLVISFLTTVLLSIIYKKLLKVVDKKLLI